MKTKKRVDYGKMAEFLAKSLQRFYPDKHIFVGTKWTKGQEACWSHISASRKILKSVDEEYESSPEMFGTIYPLYCGSLGKTMEDSMKNLVEEFIKDRENKLGIMNINEILMNIDILG